MIIKVTEDINNLTVKQVLFGKLFFSRAAVTALKKKENGITVDGRHVTVRHVLKSGEILELSVSDEESSPKIMPFDAPVDIIYEDEYFLCLNKPPFLPVHPSKKLQTDTLAGRLLAQRTPFVFRCAGRLDKNTSGAVIVSKNKIVSAKFSEMISDNWIKKTYLLICESTKTPADSGEIDLCIRREPESYIKREVFNADGTERDSQKAKTVFKLICSNKPYHLFAATPITGRTHQLRAHFSHIGFPIAGDTLYGTESEFIKRQALHAFRLEFIHPFTGKKMCITAPLHEDYSSFVRKIFGNAALEKLEGLLF